MRLGSIALVLSLGAAVSAAAKEPQKAEPAPADASPIPDAVIAPIKKTFSAVDRIGVSFDVFAESSRMSGEQWVNQFHADESFNYGTGPLAGSVYLLFRATERFRLGPAIRFLGNYGHGGDGGFTFGYLADVSLMFELALNVFEQFEALFGARIGGSILFPGSDFSDEIRRLQSQGAGVWGVPRAGVLGGLNVGLRRKLIGHLYARLDFEGQLAHQWLFSTDQIVDGLRFRKYWATDSKRLGGRLALEVAF